MDVTRNNSEYGHIFGEVVLSKYNSWKVLELYHCLVNKKNRACMYAHIAAYQITIGHGCHHFYRSTVSGEMFAWLYLVYQVMVDCSRGSVIPKTTQCLILVAPPQRAERLSDHYSGGM